MPTYAIRFSTLTGKTTVHATSCRQAKKGSSGAVTVFLEAPNAETAAIRADLDGKLTERGMPAPQLCACARYIDAIRKQEKHS